MKLLSNYGTCVNEETVLKILKSNVPAFCLGSNDDIIKALNKRVCEDDVQYLDTKFNVLKSDFTIPDDAFYMWIDTGVVNLKGEGILLSYTRRKDDGFYGCFCGTREAIIRNQLNLKETDGIEIIEGVTLSAAEERHYKKPQQIVVIKDGAKQDNISKIQKEEVTVETEESVAKADGLVTNIAEKEQEAESEVLDTPDDSITDSTSLEPKAVDSSDSIAFFTEFYERLLVKDIWGMETNNLQYYVDLLISRINLYISHGRDTSDYLIYNDTNKLAVISSGLLDKFGINILICCTVKADMMLNYTDYTLVQGKNDLLNKGFSREDTKKELLPIKFYNSSSELVFDFDFEDIDLDDYTRLEHCIVERKNRFPKDWQDKSTEALCKDLAKSIELGVKINKLDKSFIKPIYNRKYKNIQYIIPYYTDNHIGGKPALGIVLAKSSTGMLRIMTILKYDECLSNIRILNPYSDISF